MKHNMNETDGKQPFVPTVEWMSEQYNILNQEYFNGSLGECSFSTTLSSKSGSVLGRFRMTAPGLMANRATRRMYSTIYTDSPKVDANNFSKLCRPVIELNTKTFQGTEEGWIATIIHEMCHYWTYQDGYVPKQGHGREFKYIASVVSRKSKGRFSIEAVATAEDMTQFTVDQAVKQRKEMRAQKNSETMYIVILVMETGEIRLVTTTSVKLVDNIYKGHLNNDYSKPLYMGVTKNPELYLFLKSKGYNRNFRTYKCWTLNNDYEVLKRIKDTKLDSMNGFKFNSFNEAMDYVENPQVRTTNMMESLKSIVERAVTDFVKEKKGNDNNAISISPDDDLGHESPFEKMSRQNGM